MMSGSAEALAQLAAKAGWLEGIYATFFDPAWNQEHAATIWLVIISVLILTGVGLPTPEDIWLTLAGFSAYKQADDQFVWHYFVAAFFACSVSNLIGASFAWLLGKRFGFEISDRFNIMRRLLTEERM